MSLSQDCNKIMAELLQPTIAQQSKPYKTVQASKPGQTPEQALARFQAIQAKADSKYLKSCERAALNTAFYTGQ